MSPPGAGPSSTTTDEQLAQLRATQHEQIENIHNHCFQPWRKPVILRGLSSLVGDCSQGNGCGQRLEDRQRETPGPAPPWPLPVKELAFQVVEGALRKRALDRFGIA